MKTFLVGFLIAVAIAAVAGIGLQWIEMSSAATYSTEYVRLSVNGERHAAA